MSPKTKSSQHRIKNEEFEFFLSFPAFVFTVSRHTIKFDLCITCFFFFCFTIIALVSWITITRLHDIFTSRDVSSMHLASLFHNIFAWKICFSILVLKLHTVWSMKRKETDREFPTNFFSFHGPPIFTMQHYSFMLWERVTQVTHIAQWTQCK